MKSEKINFHIFFSNKNLGGIRANNVNKIFSEKELRKIKYIQNIELGTHIFWQKGVLSYLISKNYNTAIFLGDIKIISNWIGIFICKIRRKKIGLWTHGLYGNENLIKKKIRLLFLSLADHIFLYEKRAKKILSENSFAENKLHVVYNSINFEEQTNVYEKLKNKIKNGSKLYYEIVFFGRLTVVKKVDQLVNAIILANKNKVKYKLKIIGDGPTKSYLESLIKQQKADNYIELLKGIYNETELGSHILSSDLMVSPGNVGLNAVHSICYGTPVITHDNFANQMPEHELIVEKKTGLFHKENSINSIVEKIEEWFSLYHLNHTRDEIRTTATKNYNPKAQLKIFENVLTK